MKRRLIVTLAVFLGLCYIFLTHRPALTQPEPGLTGLWKLRDSLSGHILFPPQSVRSGNAFVLGGYDFPYLNPETKLLFCWIPKNACTQIKALFCRQFTNYTGSAGVTPKDAEYLNGVCHERIPKYSPGKNHAKIWYDGTWEEWALLRDPLDRFLSGWTEKCFLNITNRQPSDWSRRHSQYHMPHCYGCGPNLSCFLKENWKYLRGLSLFGIGFPISAEGFESVDHFFPQYWFCGFHNHFSTYTKFFYFEKSGKFQATLRKELLNNGWPANIIQRGWGSNKSLPFLGEKTGHSATGGRQSKYLRLLKKSPALTALFLKTYWVDYWMLNFDPPKWMITNFEKSQSLNPRDVAPR